MSVPTLAIRVNISINALAICWFVTAIAVGLYALDLRSFAAALIWSTPLFIPGWVLVALPVVAVGERILRIPVIILALMGAISGLLIVVLPFFIVWMIAPGSKHFKFEFQWAYFRGLPSLGAANGACGMTLYRWMLSSNSRQKAD